MYGVVRSACAPSTDIRQRVIRKDYLQRLGIWFVPKTDQNIELLTDPFSFIFERGQNKTNYETKNKN